MRNEHVHTVGARAAAAVGVNELDLDLFISLLRPVMCGLWLVARRACRQSLGLEGDGTYGRHL